MPNKFRKKYRKKRTRKKSTALATRVKKLERLTQNTVERNYWDNYTTIADTADVGQVLHDPFNLEGIQAVGVNVGGNAATAAGLDPTPQGLVNYGERIGDTITITRMVAKISLRFNDPQYIPNRWQKVRLIWFKIPPLTAELHGNEYQPNNILKLGNIDPTHAFYQKGGDRHFTILSDRVYTLGNPATLHQAGTLPLQASTRFPNYRMITKTFVFKKGLNVVYDSIGNPKSNNIKLLAISYNNEKNQAGEVENPYIEVHTRCNYIM